MQTLVVFCHPSHESFNAAVLETVTQCLQSKGVEYRVRDLYGDNFNPVMTMSELAGYLDSPANRNALQTDVENLLWCETLVFVYPTWWYGLPAMLKGWLDRAMLPGVAFHLPESERARIRPGLRHVGRLALFTTCGASWLQTQLMGAPGKRTIMRGVRHLCAPRLRCAYAAHYRMDFSTQRSRRRHLDNVAAKMDRLLK